MILSFVPTPIPRRNKRRKIENDVRIATIFIILGLFPTTKPIPIPKIIMANTIMMSSSIAYTCLYFVSKLKFCCKVSKYRLAYKL